MPVFDFSGAAEEPKQGECTYTIIRSNEKSASPEKPILVLDGRGRIWGRYETYQSAEHYGFYDLRRPDPAGSHPPLGQKEPGGGQISRGISGRTASCPESTFHYDECTVEKPVF